MQLINYKNEFEIYFTSLIDMYDINHNINVLLIMVLFNKFIFEFLILINVNSTAIVFLLKYYK